MEQRLVAVAEAGHRPDAYRFFRRGEQAARGMSGRTVRAAVADGFLSSSLFLFVKWSCVPHMVVNQQGALVAERASFGCYVRSRRLMERETISSGYAMGSSS